MHDHGTLTGTAYASILIALHLLFIVVYCYRVKVKELDANNKSLGARILGLVFCVALLMVVSQVVTADSDDLKRLALVLLLLCAVHTLILFTLMVKTERVDEAETHTAGKQPLI